MARFGLLLVCGLAACGPFKYGDSSDTSEEDDGLTDWEREWVDAHNAMRRQTEPTPDPELPEMSWDPELAVIAAEWGEGCLWEHSMGPTGENLAAFSGGATPTTVVEAWYSEIADYDYDSNECAPGKMCGHYTQVVWRDTIFVGCAEQACDDIEGAGFGGAYFVCEYSPPGNYVGERPY